MSGTTEVFIKDVPVVASLTGIKIFAYTNDGQYRGVEPSAFGQSNGDGQPVGGVQLSDSTPVTLGVATPGTALTASRADHKHPMPTAVQVGAAPTVHTHPISEVTNLQAALDSKAPISHNHTTLQIIGLDAALAGKAPISHQHPVSDITGLDASLATKENIAAKGNPGGYAPLDETGRVPAGFLPAGSGTGGTTGGGGGASLDSGTIDGQVAVWSQSEGRWKAQTPGPITSDRTPTIERNAPTVLSFLDYNRRNIVLSGNASLTLAASEIGTVPNQGMEFVIINRHTSVNTLTFGAGITVDQYPAGTGTAGAVKIAANNGLVAVSVYPVGTTLVASVRGQIV